MKGANERELNLINKASAEFAKKELSQIVEKSGSECFGPEYKRIVEKAWDLDFFHILLPEPIGGSGLGYDALSTVLQNICFEDSSLGAIILATLTSHEVLLSLSQPKELEFLINKKNSAEEFLLAFPLFQNPMESELRLTAKGTSGIISLTGSVDYLVLAGIAGHAVVPALNDHESGFGYYLVDLSGAGVTISSPVRGLGISACPIADVTFDRVPSVKSCDPDKGETIFAESSLKMSVALAAMQIGMMKGSFKDALDYANNRIQGGRKIVQWSEVSKILSAMALAIQLAEMLLKQSCHAVDKDEQDWNAQVAAASTKISELACEVTNDGIRVMGGVGYMKDFHQERRFRDARHLLTAFGIHHMKKVLFLDQHIAETAGKKPKEVNHDRFF